MDDGAALEERGNFEQALAAYVRKQQWDAAARVAVTLDRNAEAARYCLQANRPYEAAVCYQKAGHLKDCLDALMKVPHLSAKYRHACVHAVRVAQMIGTPLESLLSFFAPFISSRPTSRAEATALVQFASAIAEHEKARLALSIYRTVLQAFPDDAEAREGLAAAELLEKNAAPSAPPPRSGARTRPEGAPAINPPAGPTPARRSKLGEFLVAKGKITAARLALALKQQPTAAASDDLLRDVLVQNEFISDLQLVRAMSEFTGVPFIDESALLAAVTPDAGRALGVEQAERFHVAPISIHERVIKIAMKDPRDIATLDKLRFATGMKQVVGVYATEIAIRHAQGKLYHGEDVPPDEWRGQMVGPLESPAPLAPFSDKFTGTRERQFDTQDLERRMMVEALGVPEVDKTAPSRVHTLEIHTLPAVGETFAGRYQVEALIGEGGSAGEFRAVDTELNEKVALKIFRPSTQKESELLLNRFKLELSLSRLLAHPNIIRLYDLGVHGVWRYLTMELLEGSDLGARLAKRGKPFEIAEGLRWLEQICVALQAVHDREVVHRDIKPQNLFITNDGVAKLMDFGIAKRQNSRGVTISGVIAGTPEYISPEQISAFSTVTHKTDLYALGGTAYTMFTGAPPFTHPELMGLLMAHTTETPKPPRSKNAAIPVELDTAILKLLEKDPARRFDSAKQLGEVLATIRQRSTIG